MSDEHDDAKLERHIQNIVATARGIDDADAERLAALLGFRSDHRHIQPADGADRRCEDS